MPPREDVVEQLTLAALTGMGEAVPDATSAEVMSAVFTLVVRSVSACLTMGVDPEQFRGPLEQVYAILPAIDSAKVH